jgi:hypothetical protein
MMATEVCKRWRQELLPSANLWNFDTYSMFSFESLGAHSLSAFRLFLAHRPQCKPLMLRTHEPGALQQLAEIVNELAPNTVEEMFVGHYISLPPTWHLINALNQLPTLQRLRLQFADLEFQTGTLTALTH